MTDFNKLAADLGKLVSEKNAAYGDATRIAAKVLRELWPDGVKPEQYELFNYATLVIHKLCRIATKPGAFGEDPVQDIAGYSLLLLGRAKEEQEGSELDEDGWGRMQCPTCGANCYGFKDGLTNCWRCQFKRSGSVSNSSWRVTACPEEIADVELWAKANGLPCP